MYIQVLWEYTPLITFSLMDSAALEVLTTKQTHYRYTDETRSCLRKLRPRTIGSWDTGRVPCPTEGPSPAGSRGCYCCASSLPSKGPLGNYLAPEEKNTTQTFTAHVTSGACCAREGTGSGSVLKRMQLPKRRSPAPSEVTPASQAPQHPLHPGRALQSEAANSSFPQCRRHLPCTLLPAMYQACPTASLHPLPRACWGYSPLPRAGDLPPPPRTATQRRQRQRATRNAFLHISPLSPRFAATERFRCKNETKTK